jgi:hypothetical protein
MAVEWIPGDSLIEIVGSALVVTSLTSILEELVWTGRDITYLETFQAHFVLTNSSKMMSGGER